jgi:hypothetical protein
MTFKSEASHPRNGLLGKPGPVYQLTSLD